jgi:hypothetical protein
MFLIYQERVEKAINWSHGTSAVLSFITSLSALYFRRNKKTRIEKSFGKLFSAFIVLASTIIK